MLNTRETARTQSITPLDALKKVFGGQCLQGCADAVFLSANRRSVLGVAGLPYQAPVAQALMNASGVGELIRGTNESQLFIITSNGVFYETEHGRQPLAEMVIKAVRDVCQRVLEAPGTLNDRGELLLNLKAGAVGPHYAVNLLLGQRAHFANPLYTTPKSTVDAFGRGSFRASGGKQVLATRYTLNVEENGEPENRQFYLTEDGRQIFWSGNARDNVKSATCLHSQGRTVISYETECGLRIRRTILILPQEEGMPTAVEAQRVEIENLTDRRRTLRLVATGMFGITDPGTLTSDIVYANVVVESEVAYRDGSPLALTLHHKDKLCLGEKRFAMLLSEGRGMDDFCVSRAAFLGGGTLERPDGLPLLPSVYERKNTPFFAMGRELTLREHGQVTVDLLTGMLETEGDASAALDAALDRLAEKYAHPQALTDTLQEVSAFWERYSAYLQPQTGDARLNAYVGHNLPFQVLYQTYVSRAFAWTQKSYRETGFREIQDLYASMYYLHAIGEDALIRELLSNWIRNVFRMGYAYHNFTLRGKEPGDCSDDQLWLTQAVYRYVMMTGDTDLLSQRYQMAGETEERTLWDTLMAILRYSGEISVGKHGFPLLDKADWNDTLRLDAGVLQGPAKEAAYRAQLAETGEEWGAPLRTSQSESVMNACLLLIAAEETARLAELTGRGADRAHAEEMAAGLRQRLQKYAWKGDSFARCMINDGRGYDYLGATGDGLAMNPEEPGTYFLNAYSWPILACAASEEQIALMLGCVERYLKTEAGLKLCTLVRYELLGFDTATGLYFPGDRENGGVFKHAAMMAAVASLRAARMVSDEKLARRLAELAYFMIDRTLPYKVMDNPYVLKGNPRFCTQYNNSETCEQIGPILSGTATWLTLCAFEMFGIDQQAGEIRFSPVLRPGERTTGYSMRIGATTLRVKIQAGGESFRVKDGSRMTLDGEQVEYMRCPLDGQDHQIVIEL